MMLKRVLNEIFIAALALQLGLSVAAAQSLRERVMEDIRQKCVMSQQTNLGVDDDLDEPVSDDFVLHDNSDYSIQITPSGLEAEVIYHSFSCAGEPSGWCGTSGCSFNIIVGSAIYEGSGGRPFSIDGDRGVFVMIPQSGSACVDGSGRRGNGSDSCFGVAVWEERTGGFRSMTNETLRRVE